MASSPYTPTIKAELSRLNRLQFSPDVEARFDLEGVHHGKRVGRITLVMGTVIYDAFLYADWQLVPDVAHWLLILRFGVFTSLALLILCLLPHTTKTWQIDTMAVLGTVVGVLIPIVTMLFSQSPYVLIYQFGSMITVTYFTLVQRVRVRMAALGLALVLIIQLFCVALRPEIDSPSFHFVVNFYLSGSILLLMGSFVLERTERHSFLERLHGELLLEHIERTARTDLLTGLSNRHHLEEVGQALSAMNQDVPIAAMMIDIDHFKRFNDSQGHLAGDRCIRNVADLIGDELRLLQQEGVQAFRFGGEEFLVVLPDWDKRQAFVLGEAIRHRLKSAAIPHPAMGENAQVTVSLGVAARRSHDFSLDTLIGKADAALYRAKQAGRNRLVVAA